MSVIKYKSWSLICNQLVKQESKKTLFNILRGKVGLTLKLSKLIEYQIRTIFMEKVYRKYAPKASPRPLSNFGK